MASEPDPETGLRLVTAADLDSIGGFNGALARHVEERLLAGGRKLSATQWTQLVQAARAAKESLLGDHAPERHGISVAAEGSRLLSGTLSTEIQRAEAGRLILEGFFPACAPGETPRRAARTALQELGLPYAQDPAITRHLAAFLRQHAAACFSALHDEPGRDALPRPDAILFNGGVFNSPKISQRLIEVVSSWWPDAPPIGLLPHQSLELAVARGAACTLRRAGRCTGNFRAPRHLPDSPRSRRRSAGGSQEPSVRVNARPAGAISLVLDHLGSD